MWRRLDREEGEEGASEEVKSVKWTPRGWWVGKKVVVVLKR